MQGWNWLDLATYPKPLVGILCDRALDTIANPRMVSIKERTLWCNFDILYVEGRNQKAAVALSRKKFSEAARVCRLQVVVGDDRDDRDILWSDVSVNIAALNIGYGDSSDPKVITWESLQKECKEDNIMVRLTDQIRRGFPDSVTM